MNKKTIKPLLVVFLSNYLVSGNILPQQIKRPLFGVIILQIEAIFDLELHDNDKKRYLVGNNFFDAKKDL